MNKFLLLRIFDALLLLGVFALSLATILALFAPDWWVGDILSHLRVQYALALCVLVVGFVLRRRWLISGLVLLPLLLNLSVLVPLFMPAPVMAKAMGRPLKILHYNLDMTSSDHAVAFQFLRNSAPDILFVQELSPALAEQLPRELADYRVVYAHVLDNTHGSALLLPTNSVLQVIHASEVHLPAASPRPLIHATLALDGQAFTLMSLHVIRPKDAYTEQIQAQEYAAASQWIREQRQQHGYPILVLGDYNTTPWAARFQRFLQESGLHDTSLGFGYQPSWPAAAPVLFAIPIDHAVASADMIILQRNVGPNLGGDHKALELTFAIEDS